MTKLAAALALLLIPAVSRAARQAALIAAEGDVVARAPGASGWVAISSGQPVAAGATLMTGAFSRAAVRFPNGARFLLHSNSVAVIEGIGRLSAAVRFDRGEFEAWVKKSWWRSLSVRTAVSAATVRGAVFRVLVDESGACAWDVFSGKVRVRRPDVWIKLKADGHVGIDRQGSASPEEFVIGTVHPSPEPK